MSDDEGEAFPNSEQLFSAAFALKHPYPAILRLIKQHPSSSAVWDAVTCYGNAAQENPRRADAFAAVLVKLRNCPDVPPFAVTDNSIQGVYCDKLYDIHNEGLGIIMDEEMTALDAKNPHLFHSYLSALSFKHGLMSCSTMYGAIQDGLIDLGTNVRAQTALLGACIQLLVSGSVIVPAGTPVFWSGAADLATRLRAQLKRGIIKDRHFHKFLEVGIFT